MDRRLIWFLALLVPVLAWSWHAPHDRFTWWLEVTPALVGLGVMALTYRRFPLTRLVYLLILGHCIILMVGGHYTYAEVPLFDWLRQVLSFERNHYDKLGHFAQGFVPAILAREILLRKAVVQGRGWLFYIVVSICLPSVRFTN